MLFILVDVLDITRTAPLHSSVVNVLEGSLLFLVVT
jgi:hypothetical protein